MIPLIPLSTIKKLSRSEFEATCIHHCDHIYLGNKTILCKVLSVYKMYVDTNDYGIAPHLMMDGYWESWISLLLAKIVEPGMICLDIGANFGYFSLLMSGLSGSEGRTISVEANPHVAHFLKATQAVNGMPFELVEAAISNKKGEAILTVNKHEYGGGTIKSNQLTDTNTQVKVPTISLDELVDEKGLSRVDVIKLDVEGVEPWVFSGMEKLISSNPQLKIVMEYSPCLYEDATAFTHYLFKTFDVHHISGVNDIRPLNTYAIPKLLETEGHIDLYLEVK